MTNIEAGPRPEMPSPTDQALVIAQSFLVEHSMTIDEPTSGISEEDILAPNFRGLLADPANTVAMYEEAGDVIGFSVAVPIAAFDHTRTDELRTAYIYFTGIKPELQHQGKVGPVMNKLLRQLIDKGYTRIERHCMVENGYADSVEKFYGQYPGAIEAKEQAVFFDEDVEQRFFRIDLTKIPSPEALEAA